MAGAGGGHSGIIDQHVDPPEFPISRLDQRIAIGPSPGMHGKGQGAAAEFAAFLGHDLTVFQLAAGDDHIGPAFGESLDHHIAEPAAAAGNQHDLAGEIEQRIHHCLPPWMNAACRLVEHGATGLANGDRAGHR